MNKFKRKYILFIIVSVLFFLTSSSFAKAFEKLVPQSFQKQKCIRIIQVLEKGHYLGTKMDNPLSARAFDIYVKHLDPFRFLLTLPDVSRFAAVRNQWGEHLIGGDLSHAYDLFNFCHKRDKNRLKYTLELIKNWQQELDFFSETSLIIDRDKRAWQPSEEALKKLWEQEFINQVINLKLDDKSAEEITKTLTKIYTNRLARLEQSNSSDVFEMIMNSVAMAFDPHTQYFSPRASEDFDMHMSLSLEGIGAILQSEYEYTKVVRLVPKGPADKSKLLMPGDKIIGVGQGKQGEIMDTLGQRLDEVVRMIRGPKDTFVRLKIIPAKKQDSTNTIAIQRGKVKLEEQSAKKTLISIKENGKTYKIGIIEIPNFYIDFNALQNGDKDYRSTTRDVKKLIAQLKKEKIDGLIIDLRDNGGGSLKEASDLTGLFLRYGPTVQIKTTQGVARLYDDDVKIYYTGPMVVMINRMSASASEIFAGAIKDYNRGIIVGARSFGKGTVQELRPLYVKSFLDSNPTDMGRIKITNAKFYRVSGKSTQHKGIEPDIYLPRIYSAKTTGESNLNWALPWDTIPKTRFRDYPSLGWVIKDLTRNYEKRAKSNSGMIYLKQRIEFTEKIAAESHLSLNLKLRKGKLKKLENQEVEIENVFRKSLGLKPVNSPDPGDESLLDYKEILLEQAQHIMADLVSISREHGLTWK